MAFIYFAGSPVWSQRRLQSCAGTKLPRVLCHGAGAQESVLGEGAGGLLFRTLPRPQLLHPFPGFLHRVVYKRVSQGKPGEVSN